jgi:hypothetical protein
MGDGGAPAMNGAGGATGDGGKAGAGGADGSCGDGDLDDGETCDDGVITTGCDSYHDGGDGVCQPPGSCSDGYVLGTGGDCIPETVYGHVHVFISNTCVVAISPSEVTIPAGQTVFFTYHNHSVDYEADVWGSYGGGFLGLSEGGTWNEPVERCANQFPHTAHTDISIAGLGVNHPSCPGKRMIINCL